MRVWKPISIWLFLCIKILWFGFDFKCERRDSSIFVLSQKVKVSVLCGASNVIGLLCFRFLKLKVRFPFLSFPCIYKIVSPPLLLLLLSESLMAFWRARNNTPKSQWNWKRKQMLGIYYFDRIGITLAHIRTPIRTKTCVYFWSFHLF